jgi:peptide/nickel transport system ATP-binding protein
MREKVLIVRDLKVRYYTRKGEVKAVDGISFTLEKGGYLGIVGESGSGKSTLGYALLNLVPPPGRVIEGEVIVNGVNILELEGEKLKRARGELVSIIFQDPFTTLDPVRRVGDQIVEVLMEHGVPKKEAEARIPELLESVGMPARLSRSYPHQLSGGQRQRIAIAMAVALKPAVLVADEPTTALDVVVQRQIMDLLDDVRKLGTAVILITHDIALAAQRAELLSVMYAGKMVELGPKDAVISHPVHPYTKGLISSVPGLTSRRWPQPIPGFPPNLTNPPPGCRFHPRCPYAKQVCREREPPRVEVGAGHFAECWLLTEKGDVDE